MDKDFLLKKRAQLKDDRAELEFALNGATGAEHRKIRLQIALIDEQLLDCQNQLKKVKSSELAQKRNDELLAKQAADRALKTAAAEEDAEFFRLLQELSSDDHPTSEHPPLSELAKSYRSQADVLRHRIQLVSEIRPKNNAEAHIQKERLRLLKAMLRDTRSVAVICERYHDRSYCVNERYKL